VNILQLANLFFNKTKLIEKSNFLQMKKTNKISILLNKILFYGLFEPITKKFGSFGNFACFANEPFLRNQSATLKCNFYKTKVDLLCYFKNYFSLPRVSWGKVSMYILTLFQTKLSLILATVD
jgi:hypothetical protein